ncbi:MAG: hypothetical protein ACKVU4_10460 [Phycisphaerales bacterium]
MMRTLWDLIRPAAARRREENTRRTLPASGSAVATPRRPAASGRRRAPMQDRYDEITRSMLDRYGVRVRRWRTSMSGVAWEVRYRDGGRTRLIEAPRPKGPMSAAVFLHEIGHHAIGFGVYSPRCLEEYHAWAFALGEMERLGVALTPRVHKRVRDSLKYAVAKAKRRGLRKLPDELAPYA